MRFFNRAGPVNAADHYLIDPLARVDLPAIEALISEKMYFVLHAPRQTGKTSTLLALVEHLNATGRYRCVYVNVEGAQAEGENTDGVVRTVLRILGEQARLYADDDFVEQHWRTVVEGGGAGGALFAMLMRWAESSPLPLVVMFDEIDTLQGNGLLTVLRQIRSGYGQRPHAFPSSVVLCGVRDVRDYRLPADGIARVSQGGSSFNIKAESLRLGDFSRAEVETLLQQHTTETGQAFEPDAVEAIWQKTCGQPWLTNAVAYEACFKMDDGKDRERPITAAMVGRAAENLIVRRETHLDQLGATLGEERVRRVIEPMLASENWQGYLHDDDLQYCVDLGLVARGDEGPQIANPMYREVLPRQLTSSLQGNLEARFARTPFIADDGTLRVVALLEAFSQFYRENSEWLAQITYREAAQQLLLQAFLQRVVNGGGLVEREYGLGRGRTDLLIRWPVGGGFGPGRPVQRAVIELKVVREKHSLDTVIAEGLRQTAAYMDGCGADERHVVVFDCRAGRSWAEKIFRLSEVVGGATITVWGM